MIRHIVMWNVRGDTPEEKTTNIHRLRHSFHSLQGRIPGLLSLEIVVLYSEFESQAALDAYTKHPEHLRVKQELGDLRIARHQVDYLVSEPARILIAGEPHA